MKKFLNNPDNIVKDTIDGFVNAFSDKVEKLSNEWTVVTCDRRPSAHFEHSIAITDKGVIILTVP